MMLESARTRSIGKPGPTSRTRRWTTMLAPTSIAMPTVCSVRIGGYVQMESDPRNQSVKALYSGLRRKSMTPAIPALTLVSADFLDVVFRPCDVVIQPRAVRPNGIEERDALPRILHRVAYELDRIADFVTSAGPALPGHDVDRATFDVPRPQGLRIDSCAWLDEDRKVDVRILPLPIS